MNWFLLLLILKCLCAIWAAPIDFEDITTEDLSEATTTNNFLELVENKTASVSETLNLTSKVPQEDNRSATTSEQSTEVNTETEVLNLDIQISQTTENVPKEPKFSSKNVTQEPLATFQTSEEIKTESEEVSSTTTAPETEESTQFLNTETVLSKASSLAENTSQNLQNNLITSIVNVSDIITLAVTEPFRQLVSANTESNELNLNQDLRNLSEKFTENQTNKQAEDSSNDGTNTIAFETTSSNMEQYNANYSENPTQSTSGNDFSTNATPEQRTYTSTDNDSTIVINSSVMPNETQFTGDKPLTDPASQKSEQPSDLSEPEVANNLSEGSYFRQYIDSFAEQLQDIGSGVSKTAADLVDKVEETLSPEVAQNSPNYPHISNDNSMEAEQSTEQSEQPEQPPKHSHTFKETVDSFIAEVLDIGSNLNLMNKTDKKEQVLGTDEHSEQYKVNEDTSTESLFVATGKAETTLNASSTAENKSEIEQNLENLVGSASEFSSNFGKTLESLWPVNGKEQENITEQKTVTDDHLVREVTQEAASTIQTLVEDLQNGTDVNPELLNAELGNSTEAISTSISQENSQTKDSNTEIETDSSKQDLIPTTQSSVEVESVDSHQYETVSAGQGLFPTTVTPLESEVQNISHNQEVENITSYPELASTNQDSQITLSDSDLGSLETETHSAQYEVIAPVAAVSSATEEEKTANLQLPQQVESSNPEGNEQQNFKPSEHIDSGFADAQTPDAQNKLLENDPFFRTSSSENVDSHFNGIQDFNLNPLTPQEIKITSEPITDSSTTTESIPSATNILEATTNAFNKFENTLKTLHVEEKLQEEEKPATNLENPAKKEEESLTTSSTLTSADDTTILPKKFEEELQMAVKALEQTTHQQFEEFQNNLKETFKKFTVFGGMEHEKSTESTTTLKSEITTQEPQSVEEITFSTSNEKENATVQETIDKSLDIVMEEPRSGAIHQEFVDAFDENPSTTEVPKESEQNFEISTPFSELPVVKHEALTLASSIESETKGDATTDSSAASTTLTPTVQSEELPTVKHEALTLASSIESETKEVETTESTVVSTTESTVVSTTRTPTVQSEEQQVQQTEDVTTAQPEETTFVADVKEDLLVAYGEHNTTEAEDTTTEVTIATTMPPYLETESLQEHVNHDVHNQLGKYNSEVVARETQDLKTEQQQQLEQEQHTTKEPSEQESVEENHRELIQTDQPPIVVDEDITTTATPETTTEQEMVKFVEHTDETYNDTTEATARQYKSEELDSTLATLQTQLPLTQASFMEEQQQQIESTTTHAASDVTANDTVVQTTTVVETTEETINSTTVNEEVQEIEATTIPQELLEDTTTITPMETIEAEARSLSLPPPKLEYLQSVDGVEVFYGYSIVKHN